MFYYINNYFKFILIILFSYQYSITRADLNITMIEQWATSLGEQLWEIGKNVTKLEEIKQKYDSMGASVLPTDGENILNTIISKMNRMVKDKEHAVLKIKNKAEESERAYKVRSTNDVYEYRSTKYSEIVNKNSSNFVQYEPPPYNKTSKLTYKPIELEENEQFYGIPVNINYSAVHVPTNIFGGWSNVNQAIEWSEKLDEVFLENYERDPTLMWQYYGSSSGFLRHFPAFHWSLSPDSYDCRNRIWYIQAATCSKEVIILIDNSGSMFGIRNTINQLTVDALLKTFSNNDYINIFSFDDEKTKALVECFSQTMVQATPENIELFLANIYDLCPDKKVNYLIAFKKAFEVLHNFLKHKRDTDEKRNQAVFLLTDLLPTVFPDIRKLYHDIYNDTVQSIQLFIYFIGKDITEISEVQWDTCLKKGSIVHVRTMDEVREDTLKYVSVISRVQGKEIEEHPVTWTHIFPDVEDKALTNWLTEAMNYKTQKRRLEAYSKIGDSEIRDFKYIGQWKDRDAEKSDVKEYRMMVAVSTPVYSIPDSATDKAEMIGVAAIDVPVTDFMKLTLPHKIGVNGYAFIVTNNGYLLFHPNLKCVQKGKLSHNCNSIDLTEVEFADDDNQKPRDPNYTILKLRENMVNQERGSIREVPIKFHYNEQRRVGSESRNFFYAPLKCTPYTLGLALPRGYGNYWIKTADEIERSINMKENYEDYFQSNWKVHPDWSYCDYRRKPGVPVTPEENLSHFMKMIFSGNFTWEEEYPVKDEDQVKDNYESQTNCSARFAEMKYAAHEQEYYCDKELVELLYFDAKLTRHTYTNGTPYFTDIERENLVTKYGVLLRFVATQGGLTRWQFINKDVVSDFPDKYPRALDEIWYKSAVLLHHLDSRNFVFTLSPKYNENNGFDASSSSIIASHAIFYEKDGNEAPGVVVGFQATFNSLYHLFMNITREINTEDMICGVSIDCYLIDTNGYIVIADRKRFVGRFIGTIEGSVMEEMLSMRVFRRIPMFDYQAQCPGYFAQYKDVERLPLYTARTSHGFSDKCKTRRIPTRLDRGQDDELMNKTDYCDKMSNLYLFQNLSAYLYVSNQTLHAKNCSRPFYVRRVEHTNLLLLVVDPNHDYCVSNISVEPVDVVYENSTSNKTACNKLNINEYPRKKLQGCNEQILTVKNVELCGQDSNFKPVFIIMMLSFFLLLI